MELPSTDKILTLDFEGEKVTLQYHPASLAMSSTAQTKNIIGLEEIITFVSPATTADSTIRLSTYFTALIPKRMEAQLKHKIAGAAYATAAAAAGGFGGKQVLDAFEGALGVVSLAKGGYDIVSGFIKSTPALLPTRGIITEQMQKLSTLEKAIENATPCKIIWDIDNAIHKTNKYVITKMDVNVENIKDDDGKSLIIKVDLDFIKHGTRVEVR